MTTPVITRGVPVKRRARLENEKAIEKPTEKNENEYRLGAYGCTFILAPSMCLRLGAEDAALLAYYIRADGCSMILESEMQPRASNAEFAVDIAPHLSACATRVLTEENAGGSSSISESMSMPSDVSSLWEVTDIGIVGDGRCVLVPSGIESQDVPFEHLLE